MPVPGVERVGAQSPGHGLRTQSLGLLHFGVGHRVPEHEGDQHDWAERVVSLGVLGSQCDRALLWIESQALEIVRPAIGQ